MAKTTKRSTVDDLIRIGIQLPSTPIPDDEFVRRKITGLSFGDLRWRRIQTPVITLIGAADETNRLLDDYRAKIDQDVRYVRELLDINPLFVHVPWVAEAAERLAKSPRAGRRRGRPKWRYSVSPQLIQGLVYALREHGVARSIRRAAEWLEMSGLISSSRVRRLVKQGRKDPRLNPTMSHGSCDWPRFTEKQIKELYETAITPTEGQVLRFQLRQDGAHFAYVHQHERYSKNSNS